MGLGEWELLPSEPFWSHSTQHNRWVGCVAVLIDLAFIHSYILYIAASYLMLVAHLADSHLIACGMYVACYSSSEAVNCATFSVLRTWKVKVLCGVFRECSSVYLLTVNRGVLPDCHRPIVVSLSLSCVCVCVCV